MIAQLGTGSSVPPSSSSLAELGVLRGEAFGLEHLVHHARHLAQSHRVARSVRRDYRFGRRFSSNADFLKAAYEETGRAIRQGEPLTADAEWLLDNFYVVEEQLREIREDLPRRFYWELPKLDDGTSRVYALAVELIVHTDSALDEETIVRFIQEYQTVAPLTIGEVWAIPIMLRLGLVENLRRLAEQMVAQRRCRAKAQEMVSAWQEPHPFDLDLTSLDRCTPLILQLWERLHEPGQTIPAAVKRLEQQLADHGLSPQELAQREHHRQAANQVSIGNVITSMRLISALDWMSFFERTNRAEQILRRDPAAIYPLMDVDSRNRYRNALEDLAKRSRIADWEAADAVLRCAANETADRADATNQGHVGYWLSGPGRDRVEAELGYRARVPDAMRRALLKYPQATFFGSIFFWTSLAWLAFLMTGVGLGIPWLPLVILSGLVFIPATEAAVAITNVWITRFLPPRLLPKLEFKHGVPDSHTTFVVIPSLLTSVAEIKSLLARLEIHYLSNPEPALRFALLTDFTDWHAATREDDRRLVESAAEGIRVLNERHGTGGRGPFYLFHRERLWNDAEKVWMGWERKRGKLVEFNRLLRGAETSYVVQEGDQQELGRLRARAIVKYVITVDSDTILPYGTARKLIGTLAHPLNRPRWDPARRRVVSGYVLVQPRVGVHLASANQTRFSRLFANSPGIDPYTTAASDVYQDLFGEGSFTGKGIYDLELFERCLEGVFPENRILSHDLIEGCHARVALASDVELIDSYPARYDAETRRQHRWIRGDWQLLSWLFPQVPAADGSRPNPLSLLSRWKVLDNLRRSLIPPTLLAFLLCGWIVWPTAAWLCTIAAAIVLGLPILSQILSLLRGLPAGVDRTIQWWADIRNLGRSAFQSFVLAAVLPHHAVLWTDAIIRALYRQWLSGHKLLEWETASDTERRLSRSRWSCFRQMFFLPPLVVTVAFLLNRSAVWAAAPWLIAWLAAPFLVHWLSLPFPRRTEPITAEEHRSLRLLARETWSFFEVYVGDADHWLPPDNVQEYPEEKIAHRLSPTNEGLYLVSGLVAHDFGFIGVEALTSLWERSLQSLDRLERLKGHFLNWYDTETLQPLLPRYVSTVDSGNLMASFLTLHGGIQQLLRTPLFNASRWQGWLDTVQVAIDSCQRLHPPHARIVSAPLEDLCTALRALQQPAPPEPDELETWRSFFATTAPRCVELQLCLEAFLESHEFPATDLLPKTRSVLKLFADWQRDWQYLYPWVDVLAELNPSQTIATGTLPLPFPSAGEAAQHLWSEIAAALLQKRSIAQLQELPWLSQRVTELQRELAESNGEHQGKETQRWVTRFQEALAVAADQAAALHARLTTLADRFERMAKEMDFRFLMNPQRQLFAIGYNVDDGRLDRAHYDLLGSEARLASYLAIATGDAEPRHWFQLGRPLTDAGGHTTLVSWGGTMFEYLMPGLFQREYAGSLLQESCRAAVARQIQYGQQQNVPWGISESAFGALAANSDYHYRSFGVPGLGLKRGLTKDLVISPYSTLLALMVDPAAAVENLQHLTAAGARGAWGFYDALDFTRERVPLGKRSIVVRCYMAHHQGMGLLAIANLLLDGRVRERFHRHPLARASELLLQERPHIVGPRIEPHADEVAAVELPPAANELVSRRVVEIETPAPRTHLLGNGEYSVLLTHAGGGFSRCRDLAVTRWRPDGTEDCCGQFLYLRELNSARVWSAAYQPTGVSPDSYEVLYSIDKAEFRRRDGELETHLEVAVSPEQSAEVRQLTITNHSSRTKEIEITSYAEIALNPQAADVAHPAFQKLFIETEYIAEEAALLARRRPRDSRESPLWAVHVLAPGSDARDVQYETNRAAFLGRGRTARRPAALDPGQKLSHQTGAVLDPVFSLRCTVTIRPYESATVGFTTAVAKSREEALAIADQYHDGRGVHRAFELAWAFSQVHLRHLHLAPSEAHLFQRLAAPLLYPEPVRRGATESMAANHYSQRALWRYGISGDLPIVLIHVTKPEQISLVRELLSAQEYWQDHGLAADLVVLNDYPGSYLDALNDQLLALLNDGRGKAATRSGGAFLLRAAQLLPDDKALLEFVASLVLHGERGTLAQQWQAASTRAHAEFNEQRKTASIEPLPLESDDRDFDEAVRNQRNRQLESLEFWNGFGGFALDGREYRVLLTAGQQTPMPWSNVIANPEFGTLITESGGGFTWFVNSRENKLTSWSNDPVSDRPAECLYLRDEGTGRVWSPLPGILRDRRDYWIHHGQGYSRFLHHLPDLEQDLLISIAPTDPVKFIRLTLRNTGRTTRELAVTYFAEWVLGVSREQTQLFVRTEADPTSGALLASNSYHFDLPHQCAFLQVLADNRSWTGDRAEFLGRCRTLDNPAALQQPELSGRTGVGLDPAGAMQTKIKLAPGEQREITFLLGSGRDRDHARELLARYATLAAVREACEQTVAGWEELANALQVETPNRPLDLLVNRWLLYQTLSCRVWGRSAFYQAGGAYGFRDQLQDVMALVYSRPALAREHLLRAAARQFQEGDVQHWWHPPEGRGTRTRFSDDYLWLPLVTCHYLRATGDASVLDESVSFLTSPPLEPHEQERYETPTESAESGSLYEHCRRCLARAFRFGPHGLPLMGCGDWNDGMNRVGELGQGESVWVGWFLLVIVRDFLPVMHRRGDDEAATALERQADSLRRAMEQQAWDGNWYRRAYFDDGTPLGSIQNDECQIDSIPQTWSVFAGADAERARQAVEAVMSRLVRWEDRLVLLFAPPFDKTTLDPGYIKGYLPGIRENGGQYTHPVMWLIQALARLDHAAEAVALFDLVNPIRHAATKEGASRYAVEPYVVAADVYGVAPHTGRGGWTWYTGSAAWMYRVAIESLLGIEIAENRLRLNPRIPASWPEFRLRLQRGKSRWEIVVRRAPTSADNETTSTRSDADGWHEMELVDDGGSHEIEWVLRS